MDIDKTMDWKQILITNESQARPVVFEKLLRKYLFQNFKFRKLNIVWIPWKEAHGYHKIVDTYIFYWTFLKVSYPCLDGYSEYTGIAYPWQQWVIWAVLPPEQMGFRLNGKFVTAKAIKSSNAAHFACISVGRIPQLLGPTVCGRCINILSILF